MPVTLTFNVGSQSDLASAIRAIDGAPPTGTGNYKIVFTSDITLTSDLPIFDGTADVSIEGAGHVLDGSSTYRGLFVNDTAGTVQIGNLAIAHAVAAGGTGGAAGYGGGGGGAGLGGGLFVGSQASVSLSNVTFNADVAVGGNGGFGQGVRGGNGGGGGGGMGGAGGAGGEDTTGGGGGGLGATAVGQSGENLAGTVFGYNLEHVSLQGASDPNGGGVASSIGLYVFEHLLFLPVPGNVPSWGFPNTVGAGDAFGGGGGGGGGTYYGHNYVTVDYLFGSSNIETSTDTRSGGGGGASGGGGGGGAGGSGGGGGGVNGESANSTNNTNDATEPGGKGGFGGGGGGGGNNGGNGGFGGGGGGGGAPFDGNNGGAGGAGGFGGGGGGGTFPGNAGWGGGSGSTAGGGGLGAGGDVFVEAGGHLTVTSGAIASGVVAGGTGNQNGNAYGAGIFLQGAETLSLTPAFGQAVTLGGIADQQGSQGGGNPSGGLMVNGAGTVLLTGANSYAGATTVKSGTLEIAAGALLNAASGISLATGTMLKLDGGVALGDAVTLAAGGGASIMLGSGAALNGPLFIPATSSLDIVGSVAIAGLLQPNAQGHVSFATTTGTLSFVLQGANRGSLYTLGPDGSGGTLLRANASATVFPVGSGADLATAVNHIGGLSSPAGAYRLNLTGNVTLSGTQPLAMPAGVVLTLAGDGMTVSGGTLRLQGGQTLAVSVSAGHSLTIHSAIAEIGGAASITVQGGGQLVLDGASSFTGTLTLVGGSTVALGPAALAAIGAVDFVTPGSDIDLPGIAAAPGNVASDGNGVLGIVAGGKTLLLRTAADVPARAPFALAPDGSGGTMVTRLHSGFTVATQSDLSAAAAAISIGGADAAPGAAYTLALQGVVGLSGGGTGFTLSAGAEVTLDGTGGSLNGGGGADGFGIASGLLVLKGVMLSNVGGTALAVSGGATADIQGGNIGGVAAVASGGLLVVDTGTLTAVVGLVAGATLQADPVGGGTVVLNGGIDGGGDVLIGQSATAAGGLVRLVQSNGDIGAIVLANDSTLQLGNWMSAGTGSISVTSPIGAMLRIAGTVLPANTIDMPAGNLDILLENITPGASQFFALPANHQLSVPGASGVLNFASDLAEGTSFVLAPLAGGGSVLAAQSQTASIATEAQLDALVASIAALPAGAGVQVAATLPTGLTLTNSLSTVLAGNSVALTDGGTPASLTLAPGISLTLAGSNPFSGGVALGAGSRLEIAAAGAAGSGPVAFAAATGTLQVDGVGTLSNTIQGMRIGDVVDLPDIGGPPGRFSTNAGGTLTLGAAVLHFSGLPNAPFNLASDGSGGTVLTLLQQGFTATDTASLIQAIGNITTGPDAAPGAAYTITLAPDGGVLNLGTPLPAIILMSNASLTLSGGVIDGGGLRPGLAIAAGALVLQGTTIRNTDGDTLLLSGLATATLDDQSAVVGTVGEGTSNTITLNGGTLDVTSGALEGLVNGSGTVDIGLAPTSTVIGGSMEIAGVDSYSGGTTIENGSTLIIDAGAVAGTGTITLAAPVGAVLRALGTGLPTNTIDLVAGNGMIDLAAATADVSQLLTLSAGHTLAIPLAGGGSGSLFFAGDLAPGSVFVLSPDGAGGAELVLRNPVHAIATGAEFAAAMVDLATQPIGQGVADTIALAGVVTLTGTLAANPPAGDSIQLADAAGTFGALLLAGGASVALSGSNSFSGGIGIAAGATLELRNPQAGGLGAIMFTAGTGTLRVDGATMSANPILGLDTTDVIDLAGISGLNTRLVGNAGGTVAIPTGGGTISLSFPGIPQYAPFSLAPDGSGGTALRLLQSSFTATDGPSLAAAFQDIHASSLDDVAGASYLIRVAPLSGTLGITSALPALDLDAGAVLTLYGSNATVDGGGAQAGPVFQGGSFQLQGLTLRNMAGPALTVRGGATLDAVGDNVVGLTDLQANGVLIGQGSSFSSVAVDGSSSYFELDSGQITGALTLAHQASLIDRAPSGAVATISGPISGDATTAIVLATTSHVGGALVLSGDNSGFAGLIHVTDAQLLELKSPGSGGNGTIDIYSGATDAAPGRLQIDGTILPATSIDLESPSSADIVYLPGVTTVATQALTVVAGNHLAIPGMTGALQLTTATPAGTVFLLTPAAAGGSELILASETVDVGTQAQLAAAISLANNLPAAAAHLTIGFTGGLTGGGTISLGSALQAISLKPGVSLTIDGLGGDLDGGGAARGLMLLAGNVTIANLTFSNLVVQGGHGGNGGTFGSGGGGGAGLGAGLFVGSGAAVTLQNVGFANVAAKGGDGGSIGFGTYNDHGGGGGMTGDGGNGLSYYNANSGGAGGGQGSTTPWYGLVAGGQGGFGVGGNAPTSYPGLASNGGFGAGGSGGQNHVLAGVGGFGGGGGGGSGSWISPGGLGGGPGSGDGAGGGGLAAGAGIFVQSGGSLTIAGSGSESGGSVAGGSGGIGAYLFYTVNPTPYPGQQGAAVGAAIFGQGGLGLTFAPASGQAISYADDIADSTALGGTGELGVTLAGPGTLVLGGVNSYGGMTDIQQGTLVFTNDTARLGGGIQDAGAVVFAQTASSSFAGAIGGAGSLTQNGAGTLTLRGSVSLTGGLDIIAGVLSLLGDISALGTVSDATSLILGGGNQATSAQIGGAGSVTIASTGTVALLAASSYSGGTTLRSGVLDLEAAGATGSGPIVFASGSTAELIASASTVPTTHIGGLAQGDLIDITGIGLATVSPLGTDDVLTLNGSSGPVNLTLDPGGTYTNLKFIATDDTHGGTLLNVQPISYVFDFASSSDISTNTLLIDVGGADSAPNVLYRFNIGNFGSGNGIVHPINLAIGDTLTISGASPSGNKFLGISIDLVAGFLVLDSLTSYDLKLEANQQAVVTGNATLLNTTLEAGATLTVAPAQGQTQYVYEVRGAGQLAAEGAGIVDLGAGNTPDNGFLIGTGTLSVAFGALGTGPITFAPGGNGLLNLYGGFGNTIYGFAPGDRISEVYKPNASLSFSSGVLTVDNPSDAYNPHFALNFDPAQSFAGDVFVLGAAHGLMVQAPLQVASSAAELNAAFAGVDNVVASASTLGISLGADLMGPLAPTGSLSPIDAQTNLTVNLDGAGHTIDVSAVSGGITLGGNVDLANITIRNTAPGGVALALQHNVNNDPSNILFSNPTIDGRITFDGAEVVTVTPAAGQTAELLGTLDGGGYTGSVTVNGAGRVVIGGPINIAALHVTSGVLELNTSTGGGSAFVSVTNSGTIQIDQPAPSSPAGSFYPILGLSAGSGLVDFAGIAPSALSIGNSPYGLGVVVDGYTLANFVSGFVGVYTIAISSDGQGGSYVRVPQTSYTAATGVDLANTLSQISTHGGNAAANVAYQVSLSAANPVIPLLGGLPAVQLNSGASLLLNGAGVNLDGGGALAGLDIQGGNVTVSNLGIANTTGRASLLVGGGKVTLSGNNPLADGVLLTGGTVDIVSAGGGGTAPITFAHAADPTMELDVAAFTPVAGMGSTYAYANEIVGFGGPGEDILLTGIAYDGGGSTSYDGSTRTLTLHENGKSYLLHVDGSYGASAFNFGPGAGGTDLTTDTVACYLSGTRILTSGGEVAVEALAIGDRVMTLSGAAKPIRWLGHRSYTGAFAAANPHLAPVLIRAGALSDGVPARDLYVSQEHAMYLDGVLVQARHLVNGTSIVLAGDIDPIVYVHVELAEHDVIFAEGAAAETFVDCDSRGMFHNAAEFAALYPGIDAPRWRFCAPVIERGRKLASIQRRLARRAEQTGIPSPQTGPLDGHLDRADGQAIAGWARLPANPGVKVRLRVMVDDVCVAELVANRYRADLEQAGLGDGRHSFELRLPRPLSPFTRHEIAVCRASDGEVLGKPAIIEPAVRTDRRARTALAAVLDQAIRSAGNVAESDALLDMLLDRTERLRDSRLRLLQPATARRRRGGDAVQLRRVLVIDEQWPRPDQDAGSQAVLSHMRSLRRLGWRVEFAAAAPMVGDVAARLADDGIVSHAAPAIGSVEDVLRRQPDCYGLIYLHRIGVASAYAGLARRHQRLARIVYSVADLHHLRLARQAQVEARPELLRQARALREQELLAMRQVDAVITHSAAEAAWLSRQAPGTQVHVVPWSVRPGARLEQRAERFGVVLVANFAHAPNRDGAVWLAGEVMPLVWAERPDIVLTIAGASLPASLRPRLADPHRRVRVLGHVAVLAEVYGEARLAVAPLRYGAGLKGKVLEAWAAGLPCAMTPIAAEGLQLSGELADTVADGAANLARLIIDLHEDEARAHRLARAGRAALRSGFTRKHEDAALADAIYSTSAGSIGVARGTQERRLTR